MKNILKLFIGLILFVMFSCHNITNSEQETLETNNHAYISISLNGNARTVLPQSADFEKDFELSFELQGQQEGKDLQTIKKWSATTEKTAYTLMTEDASVLINTGLWNFELSVQKAGQKVLFGTLEEITIQAGTNTLNFGTLQNLTSGNGSVSVALSFPQEGRVQAVQGGLYNLDGTALEGFEKESLTITTSEKSDVRYNKENVPCGTYLVKFELFSDKEATKTMNVYTEIVQVATGFVSAAQRTLEQLNTLYTITYDLSGGEFVEGFTAQASFNQFMTVTLPTAENLLKTGYVLVGWKNDQGDTVTEIPVGTIGDVTLTAQWEINTYTISFNANGGTLTDNATQTVKHGEKLAEPSMPTREGHAFLGWYTSNDEGLTLGEIAYDFDTVATGDVHLYAKWHEHTYSEDWTKDATHHWHASTCGHDITDSKAEHNFVNEVCTICEYSRIPEGFVLIPAGTFKMGSEKGYSDNKPVHEVTITKPFYMGKYEVTQAEYEKYCIYGEDNPSSTYGDGNNYPAYYVNWYDALVYCNKRSIAEGLTPCYSISASTDPEDWGDVPTSSNGTWNSVVCDWNANGYRLPAEAEWEYAARAGDNTVDSLTYSGTSDVNKLGDYAWYKDNSNSTTHEVGTKLPNAFGLYDMSGNVREWCWNWKTSSYDTEKEGGSDPTGTSAGSYRVFRGGGWYNCYSDGCAVSIRYYNYPYNRYYYVGFRVVRASSK